MLINAKVEKPKNLGEGWVSICFGWFETFIIWNNTNRKLHVKHGVNKQKQEHTKPVVELMQALFDFT